MLVNGQWQQKWDPFQKTSDKGEFVRQTSSFRHWITPDGSAGKTGESGFKAEIGRYHLYVALICPWACRTLMVRKLKGLDEVVSYSVVSPVLGDQGWQFEEGSHDEIHGAQFVHELYTHADAEFTGRATVPILWDKQTITIVNNESADIIDMLNGSFGDLATNDIDLRPLALREEMMLLNNDLYHAVNNGVYKAGFAQTQAAYEKAYDDLFSTLDELETRLQHQKYLLGSIITESDVRLFVTLIRFDVAYHGLFKTNKKRIADYPHLFDYMRRIYKLPGISETVNLDHIKAGYYSIKAINPLGIVPKGPEVSFV
ncbi:MAG: glutathione S-transferase family protein [Arenicella sp.]